MEDTLYTSNYISKQNFSKQEVGNVMLQRPVKELEKTSG